MGKKGKKKGKLTGSPEVQKFKVTREFVLLEEIVKIQEHLPLVKDEDIVDRSEKMTARFLNMLGLLANYLTETMHLASPMNKDYRFTSHHKFLAPVPQYMPFGFNIQLAKVAQERCRKPMAVFNNKPYKYSDEIQKSADEFLTAVDDAFNRVPSMIEDWLKKDFDLGPGTGLKKCMEKLKAQIDKFDAEWVEFEVKYLKETHEIMNKVFEDVDKLVTLEMQLTRAEERSDFEGKQRLENAFVTHAEAFMRELKILEPDAESFSEEVKDVIPLAEACIFYSSKHQCEEWLHVCRYLIKSYLELRLFVSNIHVERLTPELRKNENMVKALKAFYDSVMASRETLLQIAKLPGIIDAKTENWMTRKKLEPDLRIIEVTTNLEMTSQRGGASPVPPW